MNKKNFMEYKDILEINNNFFNSNNGGCVYFTSGTTDSPKAVTYSNRDIDFFSDYFKWFCKIEKTNGNKTVLVLMDQAFWGIGFFTSQGHIYAGNNVIPVDTDLNEDEIINIIKETKPNVISSIPSVIKSLLPIFVKNNIKIEVVELTGEELSNSTRHDIEQKLSCEVFEAYGLTECPIGVECSFHDGYHFNPEYITLEILDKDNNIKKEGIGELLISINKKGVRELKRYKSKDLCQITYNLCKCGNNTPRVYFKKRITKTINLYEGYQLEIDIIQSLVDKIYKKKKKIRVENNKKNLIIFIKNSQEDKNKILSSKIKKISYEMIHLTRTLKIKVIVKEME